MSRNLPGMNISDVISQVWCHWSLIMGLLGNSFVLYSTVINKAIRLDKLSVWIIQNLAIVDFLNTLFLLLPVIISLYANNKWVLGDTFCRVFFVYKYVGFTANMVLINALSLNKMVRCLAPLRSLACSKTLHWVVTAITAATAAITPAYSAYRTVVDDKFIVVFSASQCMCSSVQVSKAESWHKVVYYLIAGLLNGLPCVTLCVMNLFLVVYALRKSNRAVNKRNIVIVVLITASFLLFGLPYFFYSTKHGQTSGDNDPMLRFVTFTTFISFWSNPVIYLVTNQNFRSFTVQSARRFSRVAGNSTVHPVSYVANNNNEVVRSLQ